MLARAGVVERDIQGNQVRFRANESYPIYEELRSILKKTTGVADQLHAALAPLTDSIVAAFIYAAKSTHTSKNLDKMGGGVGFWKDHSLGLIGGSVPPELAASGDLMPESRSSPFPALVMH